MKTMPIITCDTCLNYTNISNDNGVENYPTVQDDSIFSGHVTLLLIIAYTFVFCSCFIGNVLVITVVILHRRMRTTTNFFLTNLAFADLCVGVFCVYQNLSLYLMSSWLFGDFMCKMYHFVHGLSYTASIEILTVISVERFVAIVYPMSTRQVITLRNLRLVIISVWTSSSLYCCPRLIMYGTIQIRSPRGEVEELCVLKRSLYDSRIYDIVNFIVCFILPLIVITVLYAIVCYNLWRGSSHVDGSAPCNINGKTKSQTVAIKKKRQPIKVVAVNSNSVVLRGRRKITRLLVAVVLMFAICNLPHHARKLWQYWSTSYDGTSITATIITISTTLVLYMNSGINPFLYAFFSVNFRKSMSDVVCCRHRGNIRSRGTEESFTKSNVSPR